MNVIIGSAKHFLSQHHQHPNTNTANGTVASHSHYNPATTATMSGVGEMEHFNEWANEGGGMNRAADMEAASIVQDRMQQNKDLQALTIASTVEQMLDAQIDDDMGDEELEKLRMKRIEGMRAAQKRREEGRAKGHGSLKDVSDQKQFFSEVKESDFVVAHFYRGTTKHCAVMDMHLARLAPKHMETKFLRIDAEKSQYLVETLNVWMMPTVLLIKDAKVEDRIEGFTELGMSEHFQTATLEKRIKRAKVIDGCVFEEEVSDDDFDPDFDLSDDDD